MDEKLSRPLILLVTPHMGDYGNRGKPYYASPEEFLHDRTLHYEKFSLLLTRIEAPLNSQPIGVPASHPVDDIQCLTQGHFLIGALPPIDFHVESFYNK